MYSWGQRASLPGEQYDDSPENTLSYLISPDSCQHVRQVRQDVNERPRICISVLPSPHSQPSKKEETFRERSHFSNRPPTDWSFITNYELLPGLGRTREHSTCLRLIEARMIKGLTETLLLQPPSSVKKKSYEVHQVLGTGSFGKVVVRPLI